MSEAVVTRAGVARAKGGRRGSHVVVHVVLILGALVMVVPFFWEVSTSLKTYAESASIPPTPLPSTPIWKNYSDVFDALPFGAQFLNTVIMTLLRTVG